MKILRIIARLNVGGPARHVVWLTQGLQDEEFSTVLVAGSVPDGELDMAYFAAANGVEPEYIEDMSRELSLRDISSLVKVYRAMRRHRPDIIHTHTAKAGTLGRTAAFLYRWLTPGTLIGHPRRVKIVHTFHGHVFHSYYGRLKTGIFLFIEKVLAWLASDRIVVITEQQLEEINGAFRVGRRDKFRVVPLGIEMLEPASPEQRREAKTRLGIAGDELAIGFVGRLTEIKNIPMFLKAAAAYRERPDAPPARFVIAGDGHLRQALEAEAEELSLTDHIIFTGNVDDVSQVYHALDLVALTSLNEGTPLSLIEGMSAGVPPVATAVGGVVDLVGAKVDEHDGVAVCERGVLVPSNDIDQFANSLIYLAKNERLRKQMAEAGRSFVAARFGKQRLVDDIKKLYRELI